ncbi:unnamed protein product [Vitrella brassicaformis CCMP3155]|uniref:Uncharacterized protein n=2 Tax=Vitrella brassicaformis TaxID=1169539 RepID=A0A0G4GAW8_VITBC|nr:unnamed protein product [Vitrella brassicaformis CCMP3155]|eukprot:CEM26269.1 unnamed protein product [Vitrella brassicaformis CCMP3155]
MRRRRSLIPIEAVLEMPETERTQDLTSRSKESRNILGIKPEELAHRPPISLLYSPEPSTGPGPSRRERERGERRLQSLIDATLARRCHPPVATLGLPRGCVPLRPVPTECAAEVTRMRYEHRERRRKELLHAIGRKKVERVAAAAEQQERDMQMRKEQKLSQWTSLQEYEKEIRKEERDKDRQEAQKRCRRSIEKSLQPPLERDVHQFAAVAAMQRRETRVRRRVADEVEKRYEMSDGRYRHRRMTETRYAEKRERLESRAQERLAARSTADRLRAARLLQIHHPLAETLSLSCPPSPIPPSSPFSLPYHAPGDDVSPRRSSLGGSSASAASASGSPRRDERDGFAGEGNIFALTSPVSAERETAPRYGGDMTALVSVSPGRRADYLLEAALERQRRREQRERALAEEYRQLAKKLHAKEMATLERHKLQMAERRAARQLDLDDAKFARKMAEREAGVQQMREDRAARQQLKDDAVASAREESLKQRRALMGRQLRERDLVFERERLARINHEIRAEGNRLRMFERAQEIARKKRARDYDDRLRLERKEAKYGRIAAQLRHIQQLRATRQQIAEKVTILRMSLRSALDIGPPEHRWRALQRAYTDHTQGQKPPLLDRDIDLHRLRISPPPQYAHERSRRPSSAMDVVRRGAGETEGAIVEYPPNFPLLPCVDVSKPWEDVSAAIVTRLVGEDKRHEKKEKGRRIRPPSAPPVVDGRRAGVMMIEDTASAAKEDMDEETTISDEEWLLSLEHPETFTMRSAAERPSSSLPIPMPLPLPPTMPLPVWRPSLRPSSTPIYWLSTSGSTKGKGDKTPSRPQSADPMTQRRRRSSPPVRSRPASAIPTTLKARARPASASPSPRPSARPLTSPAAAARPSTATVKRRHDSEPATHRVRPVSALAILSPPLTQKPPLTARQPSARERWVDPGPLRDGPAWRPDTEDRHHVGRKSFDAACKIYGRGHGSLVGVRRRGDRVGSEGCRAVVPYRSSSRERADVVRAKAAALRDMDEYVTRQ